MSESTKIQWCDSTHNFWRGCKPISAGCAHCYAKHRSDRFGEDFAQRVRCKDFNAPLRWNKKPWVCDECGEFWTLVDDAKWVKKCPHTSFHRRRVFSLSLGDWLDPEVPVEWLADMLDVVRRCDQLEWILCTKRPELWRERTDSLGDKLCERFNAKDSGSDSAADLLSWLNCWRTFKNPHKNITILASVEDQQTADERIPHLLNIPAARHGLSVEPLLGPVDLKLCEYQGPQSPDAGHIDWVIVGGESGPKARPCNVEWIRSIVQQCKAAGVPCFVKQLGSFKGWWEEYRCGCTSSTVDTKKELAGYCGKHGEDRRNVFRENQAITHPKGGDPEEWPEDLRVREFLP